jgi:DNA-binding transcriptional ArsR family regulator
MAGRSERGELDAGAIVGLLADDERRRVVAAVILGAASLDAVVTATGVPAGRVSRALGRLADAGLVVESGAGLAIDGAAFIAAARAARARPPRTEHDSETGEVRKVLDAFVRDGRITALPAAWGKRLVVLDWLAQSFDPGLRYAERDVNEILAERHPDTAMLRRALVDEGFLDRAGGEYWRAGGTVT